MINILKKAQPADFQLILKTLDSWVNFSANSELNKLYEQFEKKPTPISRETLASKIVDEIRYVGSSDIAYLFRWLFAAEPGVHPEEIVQNVATKLKIKLKTGGTLESRIEQLTKKMVEEQVLSMSAKEQRAFFESNNFAPDLIEELMTNLRSKAPIAILPIIIRIAGREVAMQLMKQIVIGIMASYIGKAAAKKIIEEMVKKFPWWAEWIGPIAWGINAAWVFVDVQGPAYRKTVPILLYLGLIALRDGPEDGDAFWKAETSEGKTV